MKLVNIFLLKKSHCSHKLVQIHSGAKMSGLLIDLNEMLPMKLLSKVKLLTENHPFVEIHLVTLL